MTLSLAPGWTKIDMPLVGFGVRGGKHQQWAKNPENGRWYCGGGDFGTAGGYGSSYPQDRWSVDLAAWLAGPSPNAGWVQEQPYCRPDGKIQPKHTDHVGWAWDEAHQVFVMLPGVMYGSNDLCPGETITNASDPLFIHDQVMAFDPVTREWAVWPNTGNQPHNNENFASVYDAPRKRHLHFADDSNGAQGAMAYYPGVDPVTMGTWKRVASNLQYATPQRHSQRMYLNYELLAIDRVRWQVYVIDYYNKKLLRYDLATDTVQVMADPPVVQDQMGGTFNGVAFSQRHDGVFFLPQPLGLYFYRVFTDTWETLSLATGLGYNAFGRMLFYDEDGDALVAFGQQPDLDFRQFFAFLYRYGGATVTPPLVPIIPPVLPQGGASMATVTLTVTTAPQTFPPGTVGGSYRITLTGAGAPPPASVPYGTVPVEATFLGVPAGTYTGSCDLLDSLGAVLASAPTVSVIVPASVTLAGPIGVSASITFA